MQEDGIIAEGFILYYCWFLISENKLVLQQVEQRFISSKILKKICIVCEERLLHEPCNILYIPDALQLQSGYAASGQQIETFPELPAVSERETSFLIVKNITLILTKVT